MKKVYLMIGIMFLLSSCSTFKNVLSNKKMNIGNGIIVDVCGENEAIIYFDSKIDPYDFKLKMEVNDEISYVHTSSGVYMDIIAIQKNIFYEWADVNKIILNYFIESKMNKPIEEEKELNDSLSL